MEALPQFLFDAISTPALLVGFFTLLGLILQKMPVTSIIQGTVKAILGFVILQCGAEVLVKSLAVFGTLFESAFGLTGIVPNNEAFCAILLKDFGFQISCVMFLGMFVNILIARFTPLKFIFLTGHHILFMAALLVVVLHANGLANPAIITLGALLLGLSLSVFPALLQPAMRKVTGCDEFALGHFGTLGYLTAAGIGKLTGRGSRSTEEFELPKSLLFFRESSVSIVVTMLPLFLIVACAVLQKQGPEKLAELLGTQQHFVVFCLMESILFAAGIYIVLQGVRLILGEILPAFKGISEKLVPNARPALDCPLVFPYAPNAVILGFLCSFMGGLVGLGLCGCFHWAVILPGVIPHFFCGATAGVFANALGGRRGCVCGAFVHGILITLVPILLLSVFSGMGFPGTTFGDTDFSIVGWILASILGKL